jgi:hypothetical protein
MLIGAARSSWFGDGREMASTATIRQGPTSLVKRLVAQAAFTAGSLWR